MAMAPDHVLLDKMRAPAAQHVAIVLEPIAHPELGPIQIDDSLFAIGRTEAPFAGYPPELVADLSRRHARIFAEGGAAYLADLDSKNGTTVNGKPLDHTIARLRDGDELGFGRVLTYRVRLTEQPSAPPAPTARLASLTLRPENAGLGLEPIVITRFPFLISKTDDTFARYKESDPHQVNYLSRRHAHIFLKGGLPYVEDLGSTNGTFIGAARLDEHAHELKDGDVLAFGGHHFVYQAGLQWEEVAPDPTVTRVAQAPAMADADVNVDKTTFVAAADSFLDIFCVEQAPPAEDELNQANPQEEGAAAHDAANGRARGKFALMAAGLLEAMGAAGDTDRQRMRRWTLGLAALMLLIILVLYQVGAPERELKGLIDNGDFATAAVLASERLASDPDNAEIRARGTEALLKAELPPWMAFLKAHRFERAAATVARMRSLSRNNADLQPLVAEIAWIGSVEQFISARGGPDAAISSPADQARVRQVLKQWQDDPPAHQRAFATISSYVPAFRDTYAQALSDLRKLALTGGHGGNDQ
jgi:pSer/pThr/pTyr-binding forkhead associated (FHA) protein